MGKYIRLITFLGKAKKETAVKTTISLAVVALSFTQAFFLAQGVSAVFAQEELQTVFTWFLLCLAALLARAWILRFQEGYTKKMAAKVKSVIRDVMLEKLMELGPSYRNERRSGNLQSLITDGVESFEAFLTQYLPQILVVLATTVFSTVYLWSLDPAVGLLVLVLTILSIVIPHLFMPAVSRVMIEYWQEYAQLNSQYIDDMQGMSTLKSLGASQREGKRLSKSAWKFAANSMKNLGISLSDSSVIVACTTIGTAASVALAAVHMAQGNINYQSLLIILFLSGECMKPLNDLNTYWHGSYLGLSVAEELFEVLDEPVTIKDGKTTCCFSDTLPEIQLKDLTFRYEKEGYDVLKHVDMKMEAGKVTAIVGKSGSGKSTIVNLLLRFYDYDSGTILVGEKCLKEYAAQSFRSQIAVVFQESYLFYGTVRENIKMARPDASDYAVEQAAKTANAHDFIMELPQGYDTVVGERGATLSGGERQRIAIARAILKDAPILILDEATSSVDLKNEKEIQEALERCMQGRTTVVIAHRLSAVVKADRIYVLEQGRLSGSGTHAELLSNNKVYQGLVKAQNYGKEESQ